MLAMPQRFLLDEAAAQSMERIREDLARAPDRLKPLLVYIEAHLFDPDLTVLKLQETCNIRDRSISTHFCAAVGETLWTYIGERRLETASHLLAHSDLKIWEIGQLIGYSSLPVFSRAFRRWSGQQPLSYRQEKRRRDPQLRSAEDNGLGASETLRQAVDGILQPDQANELIGRLCKIYSKRQSQPGPPIDTESFEPVKALEILRSIRGCPWEEQLALVRESHYFYSSALYDLLRQKSREEGRKNRQRGVELAELALEALDSSAPVASASGPALRAQAWAWIGNARRLALDFPGAERAFTQARKDWDANQSDDFALVKAEIYDLEACFRLFQRRLDEAEALENCAIPIMREGNEPQLLARALIQRATIVGWAGRTKDAIADLTEALPIAEELGDHYLAFTVCINLTTALALEDSYKEAGLILPKAKSFAQKIESPTASLQLQWTEGIIRRGLGDWKVAEELLETARQGFSDLQDWGHSAVVSLDLSILYAELGRSSEVINLTSKIVPLLEAHAIRREAVAALGLLQKALEKKSVSLAILDELKGSLQRSLRSADWDRPLKDHYLK